MVYKSGMQKDVYLSRYLEVLSTTRKFTFIMGQYGFDILFFRSAPFPICTDFDLLRFRSARISICNLEHFPVCTDFDLHSFRSAIFGSAKISLCSVFDLHRFRSARISIYMYFDMQINFRSMDFSICKSNFDLQIFRSANQISIYRFFDLQIKF